MLDFMSLNSGVFAKCIYNEIPGEGAWPSAACIYGSDRHSLKVTLYNILKNFLRNLLVRVFQRGMVSMLKTFQIFECFGFGGGVFSLWERGDPRAHVAHRESRPAFMSIHRRFGCALNVLCFSFTLPTSSLPL